MKTVIIQKDNKAASPLVQSESIYDLYPLLASSTEVGPWVFYHPGDKTSTDVTLPYSCNGIDGHSSSYSKRNNWQFTSTITIHKLQPTYLWFTYATQTAKIYINDVLVDTHVGGYNAFFTDITNHIIIGTNTVKVLLDNSSGDNMPNSGDFNRNASIGEVRLLTSPVLPAIQYGYDGFHIKCNVDTSVSPKVATLNIETSIPTFGDIVCKIDDKDFHYVERKFGKGKIDFTVTISNPNLWDGKIDPHLYDITLEIYYNEHLYHKLNRAYGIRYFEYVIDDTTKVGDAEHPYTGFLMNGHKCLLRGFCMHHDILYKANALSMADIDNDFAVISELGCNFLRLAHYPHPKQIYDYCDKLGIVVQTELGWVNTAESSLNEAKKANLSQQVVDIVNQHYNHPCIIFWGLCNEISAGTAADTGVYLESLRTEIRALDTSRWVGMVMAAGQQNMATFGSPNLDWFGCNIYQGWYSNQNSNDPSSQLDPRVTSFIVNGHKPLAYSEYGAGSNIECHSDNPLTTTTRGNNPRHDIEYQMWLHEGHIVTIRNYPQLVFTSAWMLFDIAVTSRQEGYIVCLDGETTSEDDNYKYMNDKGIVLRDHITRKDTFYLYKAEWSDEIFIHICQKNYTKRTSRTIKCYTNDEGPYVLSVNNVTQETKNAKDTNVDNIVTFTAANYTEGDVITVTSATASDSFTI